MPSRREFTRRSLSALTALTVSPPVLANRTAAANRDLRISGPPFGVVTLDPALARDLPSQMIARQVFRGLLKFDADLQTAPDLAESFNASADASTFTFVLRDDAAFADGAPITSTIVKRSLERALTPATASGSPGALAAVPYLQDIRGASEMLAGATERLDGVRIGDDRTIEIDLVAPGSTFLLRFAHVSTSVVDTVAAAAEPESWWRTPNASGPFRIASFSNAEIRLERNTAYLVKPARQDAVVFLTGAAAANPFNLYQRGDVDLVPASDEPSGRLAEDPASGIDVSVVRTASFATGYIALGNQQPPLDDLHVRRALQMVLSTEKLSETMFGGGVRPASGVIPPGMLGREWPHRQTGPDLEGARRELALSRYGSGAMVPPIPMFAADIEPLEALRDIGLAELDLRIEAVAVNWNDFLDGLVQRRFPAYSLYWGADYPDPAAFLDLLFRSDAPDNATGYRNPELDAILAMARRESDVAARAELYIAAQDMLLDDGGVIPLYHDVAVSLVRPELQGVHFSPLGLLYLEEAGVA